MEDKIKELIESAMESGADIKVVKINGNKSKSIKKLLDEIEENDEIIVEYNGKEFKYKVTEIKVVKPEEVSVLNQSEEEEITLITCTPIRVGSHRLIIKGIREQ